MKHDIAVFAGRFRPFHKGHLHVITKALDVSQYLFVIVGSVDAPNNPRNPFTFAEVREMIRGSLHPRDADRVFIFGVEDFDNDTKWVTKVQEVVAENSALLHLSGEPKIALVGCKKDRSSYYLRLFPQWNDEAVFPYRMDKHGTIPNATMLREAIFENDNPAQWIEAMKDMALPHGTYLFLREWVRSAEFSRLRDEYHFMRTYLAKFSDKPFPQNFNTADAVVIQAGFVLLVRRGEMPGKGLWALPGGHVRQDEPFLDAAIRELIEETSIDLQAGFLRLVVRGEKLLDDPYRSTRKRTVSVAYLFDLSLHGSTELPGVVGADDAETARWWPLNEVTRAMMFEDHFTVIEHFVSKLEA